VFHKRGYPLRFPFIFINIFFKIDIKEKEARREGRKNHDACFPLGFFINNRRVINVRPISKTKMSPGKGLD